jgi:DNA-binding response OmpR family regulator
MSTSSKISVAVVEDDLAHRKELLNLLRAEGYQAGGVDSGKALDEFVKNGLPDLLIIDLNLPGEDGLTIAERYRRISRHLIIIMLTGRVKPGDKVQGYDAGADLYLTKPLRSQELLAAMRSLGRHLKHHEESAEAWILDTNTRILISPDRQYFSLRELTAKMVLAFAMAPGQRLVSQHLLNIAGVASDAAGKHALSVILSRFRAKLDPALEGKPLIKALRLEGYMLCINVLISGPPTIQPVRLTPSDVHAHNGNRE